MLPAPEDYASLQGSAFRRVMWPPWLRWLYGLITLMGASR